MFRRLATVSATSVVATRTASSGGSSTNHDAVGVFGFMTPKVDYHKDVVVKHTPKIAFNPYAAGFMEALEKKSLDAANYTSNPQNQFKTCQHQGSYIMADNVYGL